MGYAIIRVAKRAARPAVRSMLRHALREDPVPNAVPGAPKPRPLAGSATSGEALARLSAALKAAPRLRKDTVQAVDVLVTASREDMLSWPPARQDAYFAEALDLIAERYGGRANILAAVVHRDESTPHMQVLVMPRDPATGAFRAAAMTGGPAGLRALQDEVHDRIGKRYGLQRGERGSKAEHVPIRRFYAALDAASKPLPDYLPVPERPTWPQRLLGQAGEIEERRKAALTHNTKVRQALAARAKAAEQIHPSQMASAAHRYRRALHQEDVAKAAGAEARREQEIARKVVGDARGEHAKIEAAKVRAKADLSGLEATKASLERTVESGWHLGTLDAFAAGGITPEYRAALAKALGIPLKPGKLIDQVRRGLGLRTGMEAAAAIERAGRARGGGSYAEAAGEWAARREMEPGDEHEQRPG